MIDIKLLRENPKIIEENLEKKGQAEKKELLKEILKKDESWRKQKHSEDELRSKRNKLSQEINALKKQGKDIKKILEEVKQIPNRIKDSEEKRKKLEEQIKKDLKKIPNIMHKDVPKGKDDSENVEIKKWGKIKKYDFKVKNHVELLEERELADFEASANISGNGFYVLKADLAFLNQALIRFAIDFMQNKNYLYIEPPLMIHKEVLDAAMDTDDFSNTIYRVQDEDLNLIGTSEHALLGIHANQAISELELPKKYFAYSMCFRKEIGSHGINEKGLWRTHQFNKVEQFIFCAPEESWKMYDELQKNTEEIMQLLELPYRVLEICTGDLAPWKAKSADIEVYRPTINAYGEVTSLSNCTDFQARDLNIKIIRKNNDREMLHTLNNTALATSRILVGIIENYQNKDGTITVPKVLQKYMNGKTKI